MIGRATLALTLALTGCTADVGEGDDLTDSEFVSPIAPQILANGMRQDDILGNGIVAKPDALRALIENPLRDETFDPGTGPVELTSIPATLENRVYLRHLIECALDGDTYVKFGGIKYQGAMGLAPKWNNDKPTAEERELVSGCMLAFINIHALSVLLSVRAQNIFDEPLLIDGPVRAYAYQRDQDATPLPSFFRNCNPWEIGATRNCGWPEADAYVGTCDPGVVHVGAGAKVSDCFHPLGASSGNTVMRVCSGPRACDFGSAEHLASADNTCGFNPAVKFDCPASGEFSVMMGSFSQLLPYRAKPRTKGTNVAFRAEVNDIYEAEEGAFYGDILDPEKLNPNIVVIPGEGGRNRPTLRIAKGDGKHTGLGDNEIYLYEDAWACHHPDWTDGQAYMLHRNCAIMTVQDQGGSTVQANLCVARPLGECSKQGVVGDDPGARCQIYDSHGVLGDFDYDDCADGNGAMRKYPVTTFLDEPCDLVGDPRDPNGNDPTGKPPTDGNKRLCERK
jgi:hypothetical protein